MVENEDLLIVSLSCTLFFGIVYLILNLRDKREEKYTKLSQYDGDWHCIQTQTCLVGFIVFGFTTLLIVISTLIEILKWVFFRE